MLSVNEIKRKLGIEDLTEQKLVDAQDSALVHLEASDYGYPEGLANTFLPQGFRLSISFLEAAKIQLESDAVDEEVQASWDDEWTERAAQIRKEIAEIDRALENLGILPAPESEAFVPYIWVDLMPVSELKRASESLEVKVVRGTEKRELANTIKKHPRRWKLGNARTR